MTAHELSQPQLNFPANFLASTAPIWQQNGATIQVLAGVVRVAGAAPVRSRYLPIAREALRESRRTRS